MHAHCDCSMSSFRRSTFSDRIARSSLLAFIALWNSALPHRRQHQHQATLSACTYWLSLMPAWSLAEKRGRTETRQVDRKREQAIQPVAEQAAAARQHRRANVLVLEAQDGRQSHLERQDFQLISDP